MLLDVNETMEAHLADAKLALKSQVTRKILFHEQDVLGIGLVGTDGTDNMVADEMGEGQYEHVRVVKKVAKATFSSLAALDAAACSGASGDLIDGVVVAVDAITKFVRNLKFGKRLVLVTDGHAFLGIEDGDVDQIAEGMASQAIRFTVLGVGLSEVKPEGGEGGGASAREQFVRCLGRFREKLGDRFELQELSDTPPLPGGYTVGEKVFFTGASETVSSGDKLVHRQQGEVTGPATTESVKGKGVRVRFPGNKGYVNCHLTSVRRLRAASAATNPACAPHS